MSQHEPIDPNLPPGASPEADPLLVDVLKLLEAVDAGRQNDEAIVRAAAAVREQTLTRMKSFLPSDALLRQFPFLGHTSSRSAPSTPGVSGHSIQIANGHHFDYLKRDVDRIDIESVAHALSHICRFTGHCIDFYCVAQHCVLMSYLVPPQHALWALMHEAGEPLVGDMNKPLKLLLDQFDRMEGAIERAVLRKFGLDPDAKPITIKPADLVMLLTERRDLMPKVRAVAWDARGLACAWEPIPAEESDAPWAGLQGLQPMSQVIVPMDSRSAKQAFLNRYLELAFDPAVEQEGTLVWSRARRTRPAASPAIA